MEKKFFTGNYNNWWRHFRSGSGTKICVRAFCETIPSKVSSCQKEIYSENLNDISFFWLLSAALNKLLLKLINASHITFIIYYYYYYYYHYYHYYYYYEYHIVKAADLDEEFASPDQFRPNFLLAHMTRIVSLASKMCASASDTKNWWSQSATIAYSCSYIQRDKVL